jgi:cellulose synthase/poly-beta-1,6-N-acetylglucosamine synthase-like glycosyltransferase
MANFALSAATGALVVLGALSALLFASALAYAAFGLRRQRRYAATAMTLLAFAAAFTPLGIWVVCVIGGAVVVAQASCYLYFAARTLLRRRPPERALAGPLPSVAVIVAARDESAVIADTLLSLDELDYPRELLEIVVIDDGSSDRTDALAAAVQGRARHRMSVRRHGISGGKARRLNEATAELSSELVLFLDADHQVEPDLIRGMVALLDGRPDVACVQVASSARNADENLLTKLLEMEYLFRCHSLYSGKQVAMFVGSGGMVRRAALERVGGFDPEMLTEDVEMSYRLYRAGHRIVYDDSLTTYDLAASTFKSFFTQRLRWMRGLWQAMALHRHERRAGLGRVRAYYLQFCLDGFGALCLCLLMMYFTVAWFGLIAFPATAVILYMLASCALSFSLGCVRGGQPGKLLYLPLVPVYIVVHTIPMSWALIDSFLLRRPLTWVKTERAAHAGAELIIGGRA